MVMLFNVKGFGALCDNIILIVDMVMLLKEAYYVKLL
jgi:hypothetical protein